jgi:TonB family protein
MRPQIRHIVLVLFLAHVATHNGVAADELENASNAKALAIYAPRPEYPYEARARGQKGAGVAILAVDPNTGLVTKAEMGISTGHVLLDHAAVNAFRRWRFKPGTVSKVRIPIRFTMAGAVVSFLDVKRKIDMDEALAPFLGKGTILHAPQPRYPLPQQWTNKQGKGIYEMHVGKDGKVEDVRILKTSGDPTFDEITVSALRKWRLRRGPLIVELPLAFKLTPSTYDFWVAER